MLMKPDHHKKRIAVSGATGFIGRYVLAELAKTGSEIIALARPGKKCLPALNNGQWVFADVSTIDQESFNMIKQPDVLIHLAWEGLPNYRSLHHFESELQIHYRFLKGLIQQGLKSLIVAGTCLEYGMQSGSLASNIQTYPVTVYGFAKDTLRKQLEFLRKELPFNLTWARLFYMYGDGQCSASLYSQLKEAVHRKEKKFQMSGGKQLRDFLPVTEVARQLVCLALKQGTVGPINICSGTPVSVRNLVENWIYENGWDIQLDVGYYPYPDYEPMEFWGEKNIKVTEE